MCGIAGLIDRRNDSRACVQRMIDALRHRGPDDYGVYEAHGVTLGHRRLSIIDLAGGHQPLVDEAAEQAIVFNGELYNYKELRTGLIREGVGFDTNTDTEVILRLYQKSGKDLLKSLRGMFAFAIWDGRKRELFAARDHLGQKPFYYHVAAHNFVFASEIKALLAFDRDLRRVDHEALDQYFSLRLIAPPHSMFRDVRKLPPAHYLTYSLDRGLEIERYWALCFEPKTECSEADILDELEQRMIETARLHMVSDVPVGAFMSGGLDSTLIVATLMKHVAREAMPTFTLGLPYQRYNEAPLARLVAEQYGTEHHESVEVPSLVKYLPNLVSHLDEPSDPLSICTYLVSEMARKHVKVVLGGDGGDELFGGYDRYYGNLYADRYSRIPVSIRSRLIGPTLGRLPEGRWYKSRVHQLKWLHRLSFQRGGDRYAKSLSYSYFADAAKYELYGPVMRERTLCLEAEGLIAAAYDSAEAQHPVDRMLAADSSVRLPDHPVMITDRMTMAHGLEARSPFMDHTLAEFMAQIPVRFKVRGRSLRYLQRRLAERYLPAELLRFPKQGFSSPLTYLLKDEYKLLFAVFLRRPALAEAGLVNPDTVCHLLDQHLTRRVDHGNRLWLLLNAEVWYRMHIVESSVDHIHQTIGEART